MNEHDEPRIAELEQQLADLRGHAQELAEAARAIQAHRVAAKEITAEQSPSDYNRLMEALKPFPPL
jgi:hypothetical protein